MSCTYTGLTGTYGHEPEVWSTKTKPNSSHFHFFGVYLLQLRPSCSYQYLPKCCILQFTNQGICLAQHYLSIPQTLPFMGETPPLKPPYPRPPFPNHVPHSPLYFSKLLARHPCLPTPDIKSNFLLTQTSSSPCHPHLHLPLPSPAPPAASPQTICHYPLIPGEMACTAAQTACSTCSATEHAALVMRLDASGLMHSSSSPSWHTPLHSPYPSRL